MEKLGDYFAFRVTADGKVQDGNEINCIHGNKQFVFRGPHTCTSLTYDLLHKNPSAYQRVLVADERSKKANEKRCSKTTYLSCATDQPMSDWGLSLSEFIGGLRLSMYQEEWLHFFLSLTIWILACRMSDAVLYRGRWKITICYNFNLTIEQQAKWLRPFCRKKVLPTIEDICQFDDFGLAESLKLFCKKKVLTRLHR